MNNKYEEKDDFINELIVNIARKYAINIFNVGYHKIILTL